MHPVSKKIIDRLSQDDLAEPAVDLGGQSGLRKAMEEMEKIFHGKERVAVREKMWAAAHKAALESTVPTEEEMSALPPKTRALWDSAAQKPSLSRVKGTAELTWGGEEYQERLNQAVKTAAMAVVHQFKGATEGGGKDD